MKIRRVFLGLCVLSAFAYLVLLIFLLQTLVFDGVPADPLRVDSVAVYKKTDGQGMLLKVAGDGFDDRVGAWLAYDAGNQDAIVATLPSWDQLQKVAIVGDKAYLANRHRGFQVADISDFRKPFIVGSVDTPGVAWSLAVAGSYAYVADDHAGLQVVAIDDPGQPKIVASVPLPGKAFEVVLSGSKAFVAVRNGGVQVVVSIT
ncbi:MAG: hypothetical protein R2864_14890 [Syntrophotaleaceae bacterium]